MVKIGDVIVATKDLMGFDGVPNKLEYVVEEILPLRHIVEGNYMVRCRSKKGHYNTCFDRFTLAGMGYDTPFVGIGMEYEKENKIGRARKEDWS